MPKTPISSDGEAPKKRTRKAAPTMEETNTKVVKSKAATTKSAKAKAEPAETPAAPLAPAMTGLAAQIAHEVIAMPSIEERIRQRAYEIYLRRGGRGGSPEQDWLQATAEIYEESVA